MSRRSRKKRSDGRRAKSDDRPADGGGGEEPTGDPPDADEVRVSGWKHEEPTVRRRPFPGPEDAREPVRVTLAREAYAELILHAKGDLDHEICGVLVGEYGEDDAGVYVVVEAVIRGASAQEGDAHVTYTQETWNHIHEQMETTYPRLHIVGWYHSHPGFGVAFSEMDRFIQSHFFSGPNQIGFVTDPLGGEEAILANTRGGIEEPGRFWVEGRERRCRGAGAALPASLVPTEPAMAELGEALDAVQRRLGQVLGALDDQRASVQKVLLVIGIVVAVAVVGWIGYGIYARYAGRLEPPQLADFAKVPVRIGDKTCLLGVQVVSWQVPPELDAIYVEMARLKAEQAAKEAVKKSGAADAVQSQPSAGDGRAPGAGGAGRSDPP